MLNGFELLADDGSDIHTPTNANVPDSYFQTAPESKGYNLFHLNALYNLLDKRYVDAISFTTKVKFSLITQYAKIANGSYASTSLSKTFEAIF